MDGGGNSQRGGIVDLAQLLDDDPELCLAVEAELIKAGLRLRWLCDGTDRLNWRDLWVVIRAADPDSLVHRAIDSESFGWSRTQYMLADIIDHLAGANWQRSGDKRRPKPKPFPRPGTQQESTQFGERSGFEPEAAGKEEMADWLGIEL